MDGIKPIDLIVLTAFGLMFVVGYIQGVPRRLFGILAILFSLLVAAQLRAPLGSYLASNWNTITPGYSYMVAFGAVFLAAAVTLSIAIELSYQSAPLIKRWPAADEILGGLLGLLEGAIILIAVFLILDPFFEGAAGGPVQGEFGVLRWLHGAFEGSLTATIVRGGLIPAFLTIFGWLIPQDLARSFSGLLVASR